MFMNTLYKLLIISGVFLLSGFTYCYYNFQFWTHVNTDNFVALTEYDGQCMEGLRGTQILIHKKFEPLMHTIDQYAKNNQIELVINQSYRSGNQTLSGAVVKPGQSSNHLAGFAIDFNLKSLGKKYFAKDLTRNKLATLPGNIQKFIKDIRKHKDLRWGGDFKTADPVHIDKAINLNSKHSWKSYSKKCAIDYSNRIPKWQIWK